MIHAVAMLRRCISELSAAPSRRRRFTAEMSSFLSSRSLSNASGPKSTPGSNISNATQPNPSQGSAPTKVTPRSGNYGSKIFLGSVAVGAAAVAAYKTGYIDLNTKDAASSVKPSMLDAQKASENLNHYAEEASIPVKEDHSADEAYIPVNEEQSKIRPDIHTVDENAEPENNAEPQGEINKGVSSEVTPSEDQQLPPCTGGLALGWWLSHLKELGYNLTRYEALLEITFQFPFICYHPPHANQAAS